MRRAAVCTDPASNPQRHRIHLVVAAGTGLRAGEPLVYFDQMLALRLGLVFQLLDQAEPACVSNMLRQLPVLQQVLHLQCLDYHGLVFVNELSE